MGPIKTALCSFGMSGKVFHAPFLHAHTGFKLYAVLERNSKTAQQLYPDAISYSSIESLLADEDIELVIVNTPNNTHFDYALKSLHAGKHVVVEKPFTVTVAEASELISLAKSKNKLISVYQNRRWDSDFKTVQHIVENTLVGNIIEAEFHFDRYRPGLSTKQHKELPVKGNGIVYDLGSHLIDQAIYLFGFPVAVYADIRSIREGSQIDDYMDILLYYENKRVRLKANYLVREPVPSYIINGSKGSFLKSRADVQETDLINGRNPLEEKWGEEVENQKGLMHTELNGEVIRDYISTLAGNYMEYYNGLYNAIRYNESLPVKGEEGRQVIQIIEAAYESQAKSEKIKVKSANPVNS